MATLLLGQPSLRGLDLLLDLDCLAVTELGGLCEIGGALGAVGLGTYLFELGPEAADATDDLFLLIPARAKGSPLFNQLRKLLLERREPFLGNLVGLLLQRLTRSEERRVGKEGR